MRVDFKLHTLGETKVHEDKKEAQQEVGFSLVGQTVISRDVLTTPEATYIGETIKNKVLTELVNLLQLELYGKVMSNEPESEPKINKPTVEKQLESIIQLCDNPAYSKADIREVITATIPILYQEETKCKKSD